MWLRPILMVMRKAAVKELTILFAAVLAQRVVREAFRTGAELRKNKKYEKNISKKGQRPVKNSKFSLNGRFGRGN